MLLRCCVIFFVAFFLSACGGGGNGSGKNTKGNDFSDNGGSVGEDENNAPQLKVSVLDALAIGTLHYKADFGAVVTIDLTGTSDSDGDEFLITANLVGRPEASETALNEELLSLYSFPIDAYGDYEVAISVVDVRGAEDSRLLRVVSPNPPPVADAGPDRKVPVNSLAVLNAQGSEDVYGDRIEFEWELVSSPLGSSMTTDLIESRFEDKAIFYPDLDGVYKFRVSVSDDVQVSYDTVSLNAVPKPAIKIIDSGQKKSFTALFGEDSDYRFVPEIIQHNNDGTVTDINTGLMWQERGTVDQYNRYQALGIPDPDENPDGAYMDICGDAITAGYSDWRAPTIKELVSVANFGDGFGLFWDNNTDSTPKYWSSTRYETYSSSDDKGWVLWAWESSPSVMFSATEEQVICVRGTVTPVSELVDSLDGTVVDFSAGLVWKKASSMTPVTWEEALTECESIADNNGGWRLPDAKELQSIANYEAVYKAVDPGLFDVNVEIGDYLWSSTTVSETLSDSAKTLSLPSGAINNREKTLGAYFLCVKHFQ